MKFEISEQTGQATEEIQLKVSAIQQKSKLAVEEFNSNKDFIEKNEKSVQMTQEKFNQITITLDELQEQTTSINDLI
jgi:methyl-accepting chemotaxis protein